MRKFQIERCPFDDDEVLYESSEIEIQPGLTVLVGCNGSGKTTLLHSIKSELRDDDVAVLKYDNLHEGGNYAKESAGWHDDISLLATLITSSEGEQIVINLGQTARRIGSFVKRHARECKEIWLLLDALDSGLSIDNIVIVKKHLFNTIIEDCQDRNCEIYIVVCANSYEMCRGAKCFDVVKGKYTHFNSYEEYRNFILESKKWKDNRY